MNQYLTFLFHWSACLQTCVIHICPKRLLGKGLLIGGMLCSFAFSAFAQLVEFPLQHSLPARSISVKPQARTQADPLTLPFFDDFSTTFGVPDVTRWEEKGGVYINNTAAVNPPSKGVATFDGLDMLGRARDFSSTTTQGPTDTLTSKPINLAGQEAANVYLSFYWQARGLGELPDPTDSLLLQFKTADGIWNNILTITGQNTAEFKQEIIGVPASYCHAAFQFRFRLFSRPAGPYDAWHVDYVYLDRNRNATDRYVRDVATVNQPGSLLKDFTAMPLLQLQADPTQLKDSVYTSIFNSHSRGIFTTYNFRVENAYNSQVLFNASFPDPSPINSLNRQSKGVRLNQAALLPALDSLLLRYTFSFNTGDDNATIPSVNLQQNDTISGTTVLHNYYAYDDGTAEYGLGIRQRQGRVACKFYVNTPDTLTSVRIYFTRLESDLRGQTFVLRIWNKLDNTQESVLYEKSIPVSYGDALNEFIDFPLLPNVLVSDTFYVGWQQSSEEILAVGLDKNTNASAQLYYNISGLWEQNTEIQGSPMIRPVFARVTTVGLEENEETRNFVLYPNPTAGRLTWNDEGVSLIEIYDILGKKVKNQTFQPSSAQELNLSALNAGMYILYIHYKKHVIARKVMVQR